MTTILAGLAFALGQAQSEAPKLTIDEAVKIAVENAFAVRQAESEAAKAQQQATAAAGGLGPQLSLNGSYLRTIKSTTLSSGSGGTGGTGGSGGGSGAALDYKQVTLNLSQVIDITGIGRSGVEAANYLRRASEAGVLAVVNAVRGDARSAYYGVLQAVELVRVQRDELTSARKRVADARIKLAAGAISKFDVLRLETEEKRSEQALVQAESDQRLAKQRLNNLLGRPIEEDFDVVPIPGLPAVNMTEEQAVELAQRTRPEMVSVKFVGLAAERARRQAEGGNLPSLIFGLQYQRVIDPPGGVSANTGYGSLTLSFPLYDSRVTRSRVNAARQDEEQARILQEQTALGISLEVRGALTQISTARDAYGVAEKGLELAREALRLAQLRYDEGAGILLDVTTAQAELTRADAAVVQTRYQYHYAVAALQRAVGTDELKAISLVEEKK